MKRSTLRLRSIIVILSLLIFGSSMYGQEKSARFAHFRIPSEPKGMSGDMRHAFVHDGKKVWRINTGNWTLEEIAAVSDDNWFTQIQGITSDDKNVYYYVNGQGMYSIPVNGNASTLIRSKSKDFTRNHEESYDAMNIDPSGQYLLLYGWRENAAVFAINSDMAPICVFNDYVKDAYWLDNKLYAATLDKVVINNRKGRSMNNQDFIYYEDNDQHDMTKIYLNKGNILPNMGEVEMSIGDDGEVIRMIYNKVNGDLLLCTSNWAADKSTIYKITSAGAIQVAQIPTRCNNFAAYGNRIVGWDGALVETSYGATLEQKPEKNTIVTDLVPAPAYPGHKPDPLTISLTQHMDFDKDGNLWILTTKDLFVIFK